MIIDTPELLKRTLKNIVIGFIISLVATFILKQMPSILEIIIIGISTATVISIYDMYFPTICVEAPKNAVGTNIYFQQELNDKKMI